MITCSQCGRENEIFFKFCLGCGAELVAGAPSKPKVAPKAAARLAGARPTGARLRSAVAQPEPASAAAPEPKPEPKPAPKLTPAPDPKAAPEPKPEPKPAPEPVVAAAEAAPLRHDTVETRTIIEGPSAEPEAPEASPVAAPAAEPASWEPEPPAAAPPAAEPTAEAAKPCPSCNKPVEAGHLFCKSCGTRMDQPPQPAEASVAVDQRTHVTAARMGKLVLIRADRTDGSVFPLYEGVNSFGRDDTDISFPQDDFLAPRHLDVHVEPGRVRIHPYPTVNGTFYRIRSAVHLASGDQFRIGQQLLQIELADAIAEMLNEDGLEPVGAALPAQVWGRLLVLVGPDTVASAFLLSGDEIVLGRETGHITFPRDGYVSGRHAALRRSHEGTVSLVDLGSSNGTYYRTKGETMLASGDMLLAGQQLFRVQL